MKSLMFRAILPMFLVSVCYARPLNVIPTSVNDFAPPTTTIADKTLYFVTIFKLNYFKAEHYCRTLRMRLVSVESQEEHDGILQYIKDNEFTDKSFWTSGNDLGKEGHFYWLGTGKRMSYANWAYGEPNNLYRDGFRENCVLLWWKTNFKWNDGHCHVPEHFICQVYEQ